MNKNYNIDRKKLMLPEYGRHIHQMVAFLSTIEDRELRNRQAKAVIEVMGNLNTTLRDTADFTHKLWDHLFIMSDFQLDVDCPYPILTSDMLYPKPDTLPYPGKKIARKHYGKNIVNMLSVIKQESDEEAKTATAGEIAKYMRAKSFEYNHEYPSNEIIMKDIRNMSDNMITIDEEAINSLKNDYKQPQTERPRKNFAGRRPNNHQNKQAGKRRTGKPQYK